MRIRALTGPIVLAALFATTPQLAVGQREDDGSVEITCRGCRPGTEVPGFYPDQLLEFLAKNLNVTFIVEENDLTPLVAFTMGVEIISREEEIQWNYESEPVEVRGGETYSGETWLKATGAIKAPGFGDRRKMTVTGFGPSGDIRDAWRARECEGATHAVGITLAPDLVGGRSIQGFGGGLWFVCLNVEG